MEKHSKALNNLLLPQSFRSLLQDVIGTDERKYASEKLSVNKGLPFFTSDFFYMSSTY